MQKILLHPILSESELKCLEGKKPEENSYDKVYSAVNVKEATQFLDFKTGATFMVFVPKILTEEFVKNAFYGLTKAASVTDNRGTAAGSGLALKVRANGSVSKSIAGNKVMSSLIGFFDRYPRMNYCRECAWNYANPEKWQKALPLLQQISSLFEIYCPEKYYFQKSVAEKVNKDFIIPNTVFSTVTVNKNFQTAIHRDGLNLAGSFSAFNVIKAGEFNGGILVFPRYKIGIQCNNQDVLFFMPQEPHGNTPIVACGKKPYERISLVYYLREKMKFCGSMAEEIERGKMKHGSLN